MKAWITKYALSSGVFIVEANESERNPGCISWKQKGDWATSFAHGKDWWRSKAEAEKRVEEMRQKKIMSLKKQLSKFEASEIRVPE